LIDFFALLANFHNKYGKNIIYFWLAMKQIVAFNATRQNTKKD
jgi:hypothetical protein